MSNRKARARRTAPFWSDRYAQATTAQDRAAVAWEELRATVADLRAHRAQVRAKASRELQEQAWATVAAEVRGLYDTLAVGLEESPGAAGGWAQKLRAADGDSPATAGVWWDRLRHTVVVRLGESPDGLAWTTVNSRLAGLLVTVRSLHGLREFTPGSAAQASPTRRRASARRVARARSTPPSLDASGKTLSNNTRRRNP